MVVRSTTRTGPKAKAGRVKTAAATSPAQKSARAPAVDDAAQKRAAKAIATEQAGAPTTTKAQPKAELQAHGAHKLPDRVDVTDVAEGARQLARALPQMLCDLGGVTDLKDLGLKPLVASAGKESLFNCLFGRDSIRMARDLLDDYPKVAHATILALAKLQGTKTSWKGEEEPGRILHEFRNEDDMKAMLQFNTIIQNWDFPYYGSVDATPMFVSLVAAHVQRAGKGALDENIVDDAATRARFGDAPRTLRQSVESAVEWLEGRLDDPRAGGFLYVQRQNPKGIGNQILEDSGDSVYYEDGRLHPTELPYAPVAEQGYAYRALMDAADLLGGARGDALRARARDLRDRFVKAFWQEDLGTFAQAIGFDDKGRGTPMRTVASSAGQLLGTGLLDELPDLRKKLIDRMFQPDLLAGAGVRTKSTTAARFRAGGYHNGTVWPTITLEIKDGVQRYAERASKDAAAAKARGDVKASRAHAKEAKDLWARVEDLENRAILSCAQYPFFPEFFRGDLDGSIAVNTEVIRGLDRDGHMNTFEQPPQPQGWTTTGIERVLRRRGFLDAVATEAA